MMRALLVVTVAVGLAGCGGEPPGESAVEPIAWVDQQQVSQADLDLYFRVNLIDRHVPGEQPDRVKSRLLDALVEERTMLAEARRRRLSVSDDEVARYLAVLDSEQTGEATLDARARRKLARERLLIQKLVDVTLAELPPVSDEEVRHYLDENGQTLAGGRRVILRSLLFDSLEGARKTYEAIRKNRTSFAKTAFERETQPGQASPLTLGWDGLPDNVRRSLDGLKPGEVGKPVEFHGQVYLFQVQAWLETEPLADEDRMARARSALERDRRRRAAESLRRELVENSEIRVATERLPFRYVPVSDS